jgi:hypothetical protein
MTRIERLRRYQRCPRTRQLQLAVGGRPLLNVTGIGRCRRRLFGHTDDTADRTQGDAKLLPTLDLGTCSPTVVPGKTYNLSTWYQSTGTTQFSLYYRDATGAWYYWTSSPWFATATAWTQATFTTPPVPANAVGMTFGVGLISNGTLTTDDYSLIDPGTTTTATTASYTSASATVVPATFALTPDHRPGRVLTPDHGRSQDRPHPRSHPEPHPRPGPRTHLRTNRAEIRRPRDQRHRTQNTGIARHEPRTGQPVRETGRAVEREPEAVNGRGKWHTFWVSNNP